MVQKKRDKGGQPASKSADKASKQQQQETSDKGQKQQGTADAEAPTKAHQKQR